MNEPTTPEPRRVALDAAAYDQRWRDLAASGQSVHGEADFVSRFEPGSVLDAGCGTGRVAIELAARGVDVVGVDVDAALLDRAITKAPELTWVHADLVDVRLDREFDVVAMAGNVMIFVAPGTEASVVANMARHVRVGGMLVAGFQTNRGYSADAYTRDCQHAGLRLVDTYSTWQMARSGPSDDYVVSVHQR